MRNKITGQNSNKGRRLREDEEKRIGMDPFKLSFNKYLHFM